VGTSGSEAIYPGAASSAASSTFEYAVNCAGSGGSASAAVAVCAVPPSGSTPPSPTLSLAATPTSVTLGQSATLAWSSRQASRCTASDAWTGLQSLSGSVTLTPQSTGIFNYQLSCQGYQGAASALATVTVQVPPGTAPLAARFNQPQGLAVDAAGDLWIADTNSSTIRRITRDGVVSTVAGFAGYHGYADGLGASARLYNPIGIAAGAGGAIVVGDTNNWTIRLIAPDATVSSLAGAPGNLGDGVETDGTGPAASIAIPYGVASDADGNVYVADYGYHSIRKITPDGVVTTIAGAARSPGSVDGAGTAARFFGPSGLVVMASGDIFVADQGNHTIRRIAPDGAVTTFAGTALAQGWADGQGAAARFFHPFSLAADSQGNLFVTDKDNRRIRKITPAGVVSTFAGSGAHGAANGTGTAASFYAPAGLAIDGADDVYVTDGGGGIRRITPAGEVTLHAGDSGAFGTNN